jgi:hypothetical protein
MHVAPGREATRSLSHIEALELDNCPDIWSCSAVAMSVSNWPRLTVASVVERQSSSLMTREDSGHRR